jgi:hypothetical protein
VRVFDVEIFVGRPTFEWELYVVTVECELAAEAYQLGMATFWEARNIEIGDDQSEEHEIAFTGVYSVTEVALEED